MTTNGSTCTSCGATYREILENCPNCQAPLASDLPRVGEIFDGKYEVLALLGVGGMGEVFKARHVILDNLRAIKVMNRSLATDEASRRRFSREARLATRIHHRNIAVVYDFSVAANGNDYIVSELIEGMTLRQWIGSSGYSTEAALDIALQTLAGLEYLHRAGILHRDISPDNLMITTDEDGRTLVKIIDLGLAKLLAAEPPSGDSTTRAGLFLGNPRYSSPEQLGALPDGAEIDARSDVYSFGVVLYELLTGVPPFLAATPQGYAAKHLTERVPALTPRPGTRPIAAALQQIVRKALEKRREQRFDSAQALADALAPFLDGTDELPVAEEVEEESPAIPATTAEPIPVVEMPPAPPLAVPEIATRRPPVLLIVIIALIAITAVLSVIALRRKPAAEIETSAASSAAAPVPAATTHAEAVVAPPAGLTGELVLDAVPWGRILSVNDGRKEWVSGSAIYTPRTMKVPVGSYTVAMLGPDGTQQSVVAGVTSTEPSYVKIDFHDCAGCTANSTP